MQIRQSSNYETSLKMYLDDLAKIVFVSWEAHFTGGQYDLIIWEKFEY